MEEQIFCALLYSILTGIALGSIIITCLYMVRFLKSSARRFRRFISACSLYRLHIKDRLARLGKQYRRG